MRMPEKISANTGRLMLGFGVLLLPASMALTLFLPIPPLFILLLGYFAGVGLVAGAYFWARSLLTDEYVDVDVGARHVRQLKKTNDAARDAGRSRTPILKTNGRR